MRVRIQFENIFNFHMISADGDSPFFVNGNGVALSRLQNTNGSLLRVIGVACGIPDLTPTMLR